MTVQPEERYILRILSFIGVPSMIKDPDTDETIISCQRGRLNTAIIFNHILYKKQRRDQFLPTSALVKFQPVILQKLSNEFWLSTYNFTNAVLTRFCYKTVFNQKFYIARGVIRSGQGAGIHPKKRSSLPDISCTFLQCTAFCGKWEAFPVHRAVSSAEDKEGKWEPAIQAPGKNRIGTPPPWGDKQNRYGGIFALAQIHPRMRGPVIQQTPSGRQPRHHPIRWGVKLPLPNPRRDLEGTSFPPAAEPRRTGFR